MTARRKGRSDRGAVVLELAILFPVLSILAFGIISYSAGWRASLTVNTSVRDAARVASADGNLPSADYDALKAMQAALPGPQLANVTRVVVFKSTSADGAVPAQCLTASVSVSGSGVPGVCNVYAPAIVQNVAGHKTSFSTTTSCGALDGYWCPSTRNDLQNGNPSAGPDYLGVYVQTRYDDITHTIFPAITISRQAVMRLVPGVG